MKKGFTLVELAIALVVLGLIIGLGIPLFGLLTKQNKLNETRTVVKEAKIALIGYAQMHGRLPWADTDGNGKENSSSSTGRFPFSTVGVRGEDAWHTQLYYDVNEKLALTGSLSEFCQKLKELSTNGTNDYPQTSSGEMAVVIFSTGENHTPDGANSDVTGGNDRIYEDESKAFDENYDDVVGELSLSYLSGLLCSQFASSGQDQEGCDQYTVVNRGSTIYVNPSSGTGAGICPPFISDCLKLKRLPCRYLDADGSGKDNGIDFSDAKAKDSNENCQIQGRRSGNTYILSDI